MIDQVKYHVKQLNIRIKSQYYVLSLWRFIMKWQHTMHYGKTEVSTHARRKRSSASTSLRSPTCNITGVSMHNLVEASIYRKVCMQKVTFFLLSFLFVLFLVLLVPVVVLHFICLMFERGGQQWQIISEYYVLYTENQ